MKKEKLNNKINMLNNKSRIAVIIPAFNAETKIKSVIDGIPNFIRLIIVVDDGSTDSTAKIVEKINLKKLHLIRHKKNLGVGGAMLTGYSYALQFDIDIFVKIDADGQMDSKHIPLLIDQIIKGESDYTKGNRFLHTQELNNMPIIRRIGNLGLTFLTKISSGYWDIFDPSNGYTAIHKDVLRYIDYRNIDLNYFFETSFLLELRRINTKVSDVPIPAKYDYDEKSNLSTIHSFINFPGKLLIGFLRRISRQYFLFDFNAVSIYIIFGFLLLIFGILWGILKWYSSIKSGILASTGTVLIAVLPIIIGFQMIIQAISLDISSMPFKSMRSRKYYELLKPNLSTSLENKSFYEDKILNKKK